MIWGLSDGFDLPSLDLLTVNMSEFREIQRERAKESQIHGFCNPQMIQRERSFDTFESMLEDNDSNSDDDIDFPQEGITDVLHEHESWTDDDDEKFDTNSAHSMSSSVQNLLRHAQMTRMNARKELKFLS